MCCSIQPFLYFVFCIIHFYLIIHIYSPPQTLYSVIHKGVTIGWICIRVAKLWDRWFQDIPSSSQVMRILKQQSVNFIVLGFNHLA
ncbi:hypothetical protein Hdeb2414_s0016g00482391 [Helianthus debilis subsp. tardiflorus]